LIQNNIMTGDSCLSYADITNQRFWKVSMDGSEFMMTTGIVFKIGGFDLFVIAKNTSITGSSQCTCSSADSAGKILCDVGQQCQCPCYTSTDYNYCSGNFTATNMTKACYQPNVQLLPDISVIPDKQLPPCINCSLIATESECQGTGCRWFRDGTTGETECSKQEKHGYSSTCLGLAMALSTVGMRLLFARP
jgi:hypothetical protein